MDARVPVALSKNPYEIIVGNEAGMRSTVSVFDYTGPVATQVRSFLPLANNFRGGISIDVARVNGDLIPDIIVGAGNQGHAETAADQSS
jgi:hypothetical protein